MKLLPPFPIHPSPLDLPCLRAVKLFGVLLFIGRNVKTEGKEIWVLSFEFQSSGAQYKNTSECVDTRLSEI